MTSYRMAKTSLVQTILVDSESTYILLKLQWHTAVYEETFHVSSITEITPNIYVKFYV